MKWENKGHEFDEIGLQLKEKKNIYLYGAGIAAQELLSLLEKIEPWTGWNICFVDRDCKKQQEGFRGYPVLSPEEFFAMEKRDYFVVVSVLQKKTEDEIMDILRAHILTDIPIYTGYYFQYTYLSVYFLYVHHMVFFESTSIPVSTVCNLNCRDCLNFNPHIKKNRRWSLAELKTGIDLFFNAVDLIWRFQITGGEPMLYTDLQELMTYVAEKYGNKILRLETVTNATIVPKDALCQCLHKYDVCVFLDDYRMSLPNGEELYQKVLDQFRRHNVRFVDNHVEKWFRLYIPGAKPQEMTEQQLCRKYDACGNPWCSICDGRISSCNYALYAATAGVNTFEDDEFFDLRNYTPERKNELVEFRLRYLDKGYVNFCKVCQGYININDDWCQPAVQAKRGNRP